MGILSYHSAWAAGPQAKPDQLSGDPVRDFARFSSPWMSKGVVSGNVNIRQMFDFGEMLWTFDPTFRQAMKRLIGYFLTEIEFYDPKHSGDLKEEDINSYREVLLDQLKAKTVLYTALCNLFTSGNILMSMLPPILRRMQCPKCKIIHPVDVAASPDNPEFRFKYYAKGTRFEATCLQCGFRGAWVVYNMKADYRRNVIVQFWNPKEFILHHDPFTDRRLFTWRIPSFIRKRVQDGDPLLLSSMPMTLLQAIGEEKDYRFNDKTILHLREPALVTQNTGGWGIPESVYSYGMSRYVFGLRKMNEILAEDYMIPVRVCSPSKASDNGGYATTDTGWTTDMVDWNRQIRNIFTQHRLDPASVHTIGFPIEYQILGGEGKSLVPGELLIQGEDMQLNASGLPSQLYRGDLTVQTASMAARLLESHWQFIPDVMNTILAWKVLQITPELGWKPCGVRIQPSKFADNMEQLMLLLQMVESGAVAQSTVLNKLGLDKSEEARKQVDEAMFEAELEAKQQQEIDKLMAGSSALQQAVDAQRMAMDPAAQQGAAPPAGGTSAVPPAADPVAEIMARIEQFGSPDTPTTSQEMIAVAQEAAAIFINLPEIEKRQKLREIESKNKTMKELITSMMTETREAQNKQFIAQGQQMMQQGGMM